LRSILNRLRRTPIALRIGAIAALLLGALVVTNVIVISQMTANSRHIVDTTARFEQLGAAADANRSFGNLRYWLTDLAVSLLTLSERNAEQARENLDGYLTELAETEPAAAAEIAVDTDAYMEKAFRAIDAYSDNNRIVGNTLLAEAREHSNSVQERLDALIANLQEQAAEARNRAVEDATRATQVDIGVVAAVLFVGILLSLLLVRSITKPLGELNGAIGAMISGKRNVTIPELADDELGRMAHTLSLLKESNRQREQLQDEGEEQRRTIETAIETISEGFVLFDADDRLIIANTNYRQLYPGLEDMIVRGKSFREILTAGIDRGLIDTDGLGKDEWLEERIDQHRNPAAPLERVFSGDRWVRISEKLPPQGGVVGIYSDITELKRRQTELEEAKSEADSANQAKSRFLANMSHELRTPLNAIIGYSEMLIEEAAELEHGEIVTDLDKIRTAGKHLLGLINDILDFSKIEAGKMEMLVEKVDLPALLGEVESTIAPLVSKNNNTLEVNTVNDLGTINSDQTKIRQSLFNLLSNACKFTENGKITLTAERQPAADGDMIKFTVADSGIGMTGEQSSRLFQAFSQADAATSRTYGGTGLGLAITRHFCRMLGGDVAVESEKGKGSTFVITISAALDPMPDQAGGGDAASRPDGRTVLVIDDEKPARDMIGDALSDQGYVVVTARGGRDGLRLAREYDPDIIILDVIMPDLDGWAVLRALKADADLADIPVILVTVVGDRDLGIALGAVDYLTKPIVPDELMRVVARVHRPGEQADVLIVDDDSGTRDVLRRTLSREGWTVREAENGARGLEELSISKPSIVLLDLMMPEMDGFEMLRAMRANTTWHGVPVVIVTSKDLNRQELEWLRGNAREVFQKGAYGLGELVSSVRNMVETARNDRARTAIS